MRQHAAGGAIKGLPVRHPAQQLGAGAVLRPGVGRRVRRRRVVGGVRGRGHDAAAQRRPDVRGRPLLHVDARPRQPLRHDVEETVLCAVRGPQRL